MPYASNRDRAPGLLELSKTPWPAPPLNLFLTSGYQPGVFDLSWTDPAELSLNGAFQLVGVNLYRSFDSELGPYDRINEYPLGTTFWRDQTDNVLITEQVEDTQWLSFGPAAADLQGPKYVLRTKQYPIIAPGSQRLATDSVDDVEVRIDGNLARVLRVTGEFGEVEIDPNSYPDVATQKALPGTIPSETSVVTVSYRYSRNYLRTDLASRVFYRVTAVGYDPKDTSTLLETPLEQAPLTSSYEIEKIDWIWREAVRRNRWILDQGGERVKVFLRKQTGFTCGCYYEATYKQPLNDCLSCFGTGIVGGFEGPFDIVIAPDDGERKIAHQATGRTVEHTYEVWTGPSPLLSQRDFIVKINGERYSVGSVRIPSNRGMVLQQHFNIGHIDEKDIRYKVPIDRVPSVLQVSPLVPPLNSPAQVTDKPNIPDEREVRGRTIAWENITFLVPFLLIGKYLLDATVSWLL